MFSPQFDLRYNQDLEVILWGNWPLDNAKFAFRYCFSTAPSAFALIAASTSVSTAVWSAFLCSDGLYPSFFADFSALTLAKYLSLMFSGTLTAVRSILVADASQHYRHHTSRETRPQLPRVLREEVHRCSLGRGQLSRVVIGQLLRPHQTSAPVLGPADCLLHEYGFGDARWLLVDLLGELVDGLLMIGGGLAEPVHSTLQSVVPWLAHVFVLGHCTSLVEVNQAIKAWS